MKNSNNMRFVTLIVLFAIVRLGFPQAPLPFLRGGDVSEIPEVEAAGGVYFYQGKPTDPFAIMHDAGWNFVRLRVWNDPKGGWCDKAHTLALAKRAVKAGMKISLDFHYSDWWADPNKQNPPAKWKGLSTDQLADKIYSYTKDVMQAMIDQGTRPFMVQIGNEITFGMLWPNGKVSGKAPEAWKPLVKLITAGHRALKEVEGSEHIQTMIHLDRGADNKGARLWFDNAIANGLTFDTIGLSYYPVFHGSISAMESNVNDLATRYKKDIYIIETGYPWTIDAHTMSSEHVEGDKTGLVPEFPPTPIGQRDYLSRLIKTIQAMPNHRGKGLLYWAPTWISTKQMPSPYDNLALFDYHGNALPGVNILGGTKKQPEEH